MSAGRTLETTAAVDDARRGNHIRALREQRGLSQQQLAHVIFEVSHHIVGVSQVTVSRWELGANGIRLGHRKALALALGTTVAELWPPTTAEG